MKLSITTVKSDLEQLINAGDASGIRQLYARFQQQTDLDPDLCLLFASAFASLGDMVSVEACCRALISQVPDHYLGHFNLGLALQNQGKGDEAIESYVAAASIRPTESGVWSNLAQLYADLMRYPEAIDAGENALRRVPHAAVAMNNLGVIYRRSGDLEAASQILRQALETEPGYADAAYNYGLVLADQDDGESAKSYYRRAIELRPDYVEAFTDLGSVCRTLAQYDEALQAYDQALKIDPDYTEARWNRALQLLMLGRFDQGWQDYETRWQSGGRGRRRFKRPVWKTEPLDGKRIFVYAEQGLGDTFQFIRLLALLKARGATTVVECQPSLVGVLHGVDGIDELVPRGGRRPVFDVHVALLSLPGLLQIDEHNIPASVPYLHAPTTANQTLVDVLSGGDGFRVGLVWAGNASHSNDRNRSCRLQEFSELMQIDGVTCYGLQVGERAQDIGSLDAPASVIDLSPQLQSFSDTAYALSQLDLVISVDTSVAHLAGAMGKPVWLLLPFVPDWRWLLDRDDSPWYPSMTLFRQDETRQWAPVLERVRAQLVMQK